jgi:hypothetical protein
MRIESVLRAHSSELLRGPHAVVLRTAIGVKNVLTSYWGTRPRRRDGCCTVSESAFLRTRKFKAFPISRNTTRSTITTYPCAMARRFFTGVYVPKTAEAPEPIMRGDADQDQRLGVLPSDRGWRRADIRYESRPQVSRSRKTATLRCSPVSLPFRCHSDYWINTAASRSDGRLAHS